MTKILLNTVIQVPDSEENQCRHRQMELLRHVYIPSLCSLLLKVILDTGGRNEQCSKLANVIADEDKKLYTVGWCPCSVQVGWGEVEFRSWVRQRSLQ